MKQLVEVRHNPLQIPVKDDDPKQYHEFIFIAGERGYELGLNMESRQIMETHVFRCMSDNFTAAQVALNMLSCLPEDVRAKVIEALNENPNPAK